MGGESSRLGLLAFFAHISQYVPHREFGQCKPKLWEEEVRRDILRASYQLEDVSTVADGEVCDNVR